MEEYILTLRNANSKESAGLRAGRVRKKFSQNIFYGLSQVFYLENEYF